VLLQLLTGVTHMLLLLLLLLAVPHSADEDVEYVQPNFICSSLLAAAHAVAAVNRC
jgi:hypothetical protein